MSDMWSDWTAAADQRQRAQDERERRTVAELLLARGATTAAQLVAASTYESECVDNWDRGLCRVTIAAPPPMFDHVDDGLRSTLEAAVQAVVRERHFAGLDLVVRHVEPTERWERELVDRTRAREPAPLALTAKAEDAES